MSLRGVLPTSVPSVQVVGSKTGAHDGTLTAAPDRRGITFDPNAPFAAGETVHVSTPVAVQAGEPDGYSFTVGTPAPHPGAAVIAADETTSTGSTTPGPDATAAKAAAASASPMTFASRPDLRPPGVQINTAAGATARGYLFATPTGSSANEPGVMVYDDRGQLVWFHPVADKVVGDAEVTTYHDKPAITWFEGTTPSCPGSCRGEWIVVDQTYAEVARIRMGNGYQADIHDIELTDRGTAYLVGYNPLVCTGVAPLVGCAVGNPVLEAVVQEVDVDTGTVLWEWHSLDHVPLANTYATTDANPYDYFHINSVAVDTDDNVIVSSRGTSAIYKINRTTGAVIWTFGGKASTFTNYVNDPNTIKGPDFQHMAIGLGNNSYSYFDNSNRRGGPSRGAIVHLDVATKTATYTTQLIRTPPLFGPAAGAFQSLANGNHLVAWGGLGTVSEYDSANAPVFDATLVGAGSYRQLRFPWTGAPAEAPTAVAVPGPYGASIAMVSWNGDTRTARWQMLTGPAPNQLTATGAPVTRTGFETNVGPSGGAAWFAVDALAADGTVLGRSTPVRGLSWFDELATTPVGGTYSPIVGDFGGSRNDDILWYAPGAGAESLYVSDGAGGFTSVRMPSVNGSYLPLVGDFLGDDRDEILWWNPGSQAATAWRFDGSARSATPIATGATFGIPAQGSPMVLDHRPGYGGSYDEVLWYGAGSIPDRIDRFVWTTAGPPATQSRGVSVTGTYRPVSGDFDGNGWADIFWYAPGSAADSIWLLQGGTAGSTGQRSVAAPVNGDYTMLAGNFAGIEQRDELLFATPGSGVDSLWTFASNGSHSSTPATTAAAGTLYRLKGTNDGVLALTPGAAPTIWTLTPTSTARSSGNTAIAASALPVIGSFVGAADRSSIYRYTPGSTPEVMYAAR